MFHLFYFFFYLIIPFFTINNDIKIGRYDKVYEILMGRGKTSTITPLIILNNYIYNKEIEQYNIILPNSLVISSFDLKIVFGFIFIKISF